MDKLKRGSTLPITLALLMVMSIVIAELLMISSNSAIYKNKKSNSSIEQIVLKEYAYEIMNEEYEYFKVNSSVADFSVPDDFFAKCEIVQNTVNTSKFIINLSNSDIKLEVLVSFEASGYKIKTWKD